eukprot:g5075.t1
MAHFGTFSSAKDDRKSRLLVKKNARLAMSAAYDGGIHAKVALAFLMSHPKEPFYQYQSCYNLGMIAREGLSQAEANKLLQKLEKAKPLKVTLPKSDKDKKEEGEGKKKEGKDSDDGGGENEKVENVAEISDAGGGVTSGPAESSENDEEKSKIRRKMTKKELKRLNRGDFPFKVKVRRKKMNSVDVRARNLTTIVEGGAVSAIYSAMELHQDNARVQCNGCFALLGIIQSDVKEHRDLVKSAGSGNTRALRGLKVVERALKKHPEDKHLQRNGKFLRAAILRNDRRNMKISEKYKLWCAFIDEEELRRQQEEDAKREAEREALALEKLRIEEEKKAQGFSYLSWAQAAGGGFDFMEGMGDNDEDDKTLQLLLLGAKKSAIDGERYRHRPGTKRKKKKKKVEEDKKDQMNEERDPREIGRARRLSRSRQ